MKTIIYLISLIVIVTATPIANKRNVDIHWPVKDKFPETISRLKKSPGHETDHLSGDKINGIQNELVQNGPGESLSEGNVRKPIIIRSSSVKNPQEQLAETNSAEKCKQVRFNVCHGENEENSKITSRQAEKLVSGKNMEDTIKFAKEAMDSLKNDIHKIEKTSLNNNADSDDNLHTKLEVARQALDHIHQNFGNLEVTDSGVEKSKDKVGVTEDDKKLAMWREMVANTRKAGGVFQHDADSTHTDNTEQIKSLTKNTDDGLNGNRVLMPTDIQKIDSNFALKNTQQDEVESNLKSKAVSDLKPAKLDDESNDSDNGKINLMDKELTDTLLEKLTKNSEKGEAKKIQNNKLEVNLNHAESIDTPKFQMTPAENQAWMESHRKSEETKKKKETMHVEETKHEDEKSQVAEKLTNRSSQDKSIELLKSDSNIGLPKLDMGSVETEKKMSESIKSNDEFSNTRLSQANPELLTISDVKQDSGKIEKLTPLHDRQGHQQMGLVKTAEFNLNQNSPNQEFEMIQNSNQNVEFGLPEHHTFEDMEFMKWAKMANHEKESGRMPPLFQTAPNFKNEHMKASTLDEHLHHLHSIHHDSSSQEEHVPFESNMHNHMRSMLQMKSPDMDNTMQPSMAMGMRDAYGRSAMEYNTMQWNQPGLVRTAYGPSGGSASSSSSSTSSGGNSGAVGVFPNANVGGCAIPLLLSCSPSLISGSLAKSVSSSSSSQSSGYGPPPPPPPSYRNGDELTYFIKRDTKVNEEMPLVKVLRTSTPFNHKHEMILDRKLS